MGFHLLPTPRDNSFFPSRQRLATQAPPPAVNKDFQWVRINFCTIGISELINALLSPYPLLWRIKKKKKPCEVVWFWELKEWKHRAIGTVKREGFFYCLVIAKVKSRQCIVSCRQSRWDWQLRWNRKRPFVFYFEVWPLILKFTNRGHCQVPHRVTHTCFTMWKHHIHGCSWHDLPVLWRETELNYQPVYFFLLQQFKVKR